MAAALTGFLAWLPGKARLETRGFLWSGAIHLVPDVVIFFSYALLFVQGQLAHNPAQPLTCCTGLGAELNVRRDQRLCATAIPRVSRHSISPWRGSGA